MTEQAVDIKTADGVADSHVFYPDVQRVLARRHFLHGWHRHPPANAREWPAD